MALTRRSNPNKNGENPNTIEIITQQLQAIIAQIVTQVTNNVNNANGNDGNRNGGNGNGGNNNGCTYKELLACNPRDFDRKGGAIALTRWIEKMESVMDISGCVNNQKVKYAASSLINKALTWWNTQIQARGRDVALGMTWEDSRHYLFHELTNLVPHLVTPKSKRIDMYIHVLAPQIRGMIQATQPATIQSTILKAEVQTDEAVRCGTLSKSVERGRRLKDQASKEACGLIIRGQRQVAPINAVRMGNSQRACYECGSQDHLHNTFPKLNRALGQVGNRLTIEGNHNPRNNGNQARGRDFNPSILRPSYVIEVSNGKKVETDRIIHGCILELGDSLFTIDLILFGHGSSDVIVGLYWLLKYKDEIVCHEKVVRIPLAKGEGLHVQGEQTKENLKSIKSTKADE
ncbi:hypothetical protein Tco_0894674 [Tanacetum coccineum]|uniref:Reverse transcriptase domain-containing protein n=1 Tax=Tanacetum coccineum TaxID=301880 RepID=A0ABQ5CF86_9ASTR